jgi:sodium/potassium-transporting ATPase subunit alpha
MNLNENVSRSPTKAGSLRISSLPSPSFGNTKVPSQSCRAPFRRSYRNFQLAYTVHAAPEGPVLYCKGAPEVVLARCTWAEMDGGGELSADLAVTFRTAAEAMAEKGLRVLAFAWHKLPESFELANAEAEMTLAGLIGLEDPPRPEVADALQKCRDAGIKVIMVTGDHPHTATAIAREIGLVRSATPV